MSGKSISDDRIRTLEKEVKKVLNVSKNCAQTSFSVIQQEYNLEGKEILKALTPFPGMALRGETCGAVSGCMMALGLVYGRDDLGDWKGYLKSLPPTRRFCRRFESENGSLACADILEAKMGRRYDLSDRVDSLKYAAMGGKKTCAKIIASAVIISAEIIESSPPRQ